jgi:hypothetical protein
MPPLWPQATMICDEDPVRASEPAWTGTIIALRAIAGHGSPALRNGSFAPQHRFNVVTTMNRHGRDRDPIVRLFDLRKW